MAASPLKGGIASSRSGGSQAMQPIGRDASDVTTSLHRLYVAMGRARISSPIQVYILDSSHMCVTSRLPSSLSDLKLQLSRHLTRLDMRDDHDRSLVGGRPCRQAQAVQGSCTAPSGPSPLNDFDFYVMPQEEALSALRCSRYRLGRSSLFLLNRSTKMRWSKGLHFGQFISRNHLGQLVAPRRVLEATDLRTIDFAHNVLIARPRERQLLHLPKMAKRSSKKVAFKKDLEEWLICDPDDGSVPLVFRPLRQPSLSGCCEALAPANIDEASVFSALNLPLPPWASRPEEVEDLTFYEVQFSLDALPVMIQAPAVASAACH